MARWRAAGFQDYFHTICGAERARGLGIGIPSKNFRKGLSVRVESLPPVTEGMEHDGAGAQNLLYARGIFSGNLHDHVHQFRRTEGLADQRAHAEVFGFFFRIFYGDGFGQRHGTNLGDTSGPSSACGVASRRRTEGAFVAATLSQGFPAALSVRRSRTLSLSNLPSMDLPSSLARAAFTTLPICFRESAPDSVMASSTARCISTSLGAAGKYFSMMAISLASLSARSLRPPCVNCSTDSLRCLMSVCRICSDSRSSSGRILSISLSFRALLTMRRTLRRSSSFSFMAAVRSL